MMNPDDEATAKALMENHAMQPCVWRPRDPVTGAAPTQPSHGMYGPHVCVLPRRFPYLMRRKITWMEYPVDVEILQDTPHALILPAFTLMWGRVVRWIW